MRNENEKWKWWNEMKFFQENKAYEEYFVFCVEN
jgi:hypothetical protein